MSTAEVATEGDNLSVSWPGGLVVDMSMAEARDLMLKIRTALIKAGA
jgi:hypothetical protein